MYRSHICAFGFSRSEETEAHEMGTHPFHDFVTCTQFEATLHAYVSRVVHEKKNRKKEKSTESVGGRKFGERRVMRMRERDENIVDNGADLPSVREINRS